jgi:hypothetical protein
MVLFLRLALLENLLLTKDKLRNRPFPLARRFEEYKLKGVTL